MFIFIVCSVVALITGPGDDKPTSPAAPQKECQFRFGETDFLRSISDEH